MKTQNDQVLDYLRKWKSITPMEALSALGVMRLGARIYDLRRAGHAIASERMEIGVRGCRGVRKAVARYRLGRG
jgi:hypothetical protein